MANETPEFLHLNNADSIVPPMENKVGSTYAETKAEIEARKRAEAAAELAKVEAATPVATEPPKKTSVWFAVLTVVFLLVALAGTGFGVFEYFENETLKENVSKLEDDYLESKNEYDALEARFNLLKKEYELLKSRETPETPEVPEESVENPAESE